MQAPAALNAHDLPSVSALVHYLHAAAGFLVKSTWLAAIKAGNFASWLGLTYANVSNTAHPVMKPSKGISSKCAKAFVQPSPRPPPTVAPPTTPASSSKELHAWSEPISKL
jgi:hypothetical protein